MASAPLSQVLTTARTYLNDDNASTWTDPVLIPKVQEAHRELQTELWVNGSPIVRAQSVVLQIPLSTTPTDVIALAPTGVPTDMVLPTAVYEAASTPVAYTPVTEALYFPIGYVAVATINWWLWQEEKFLLAPCTANRSIIFQYRRQITIPILATDLIGILFGEIYLAARTAAIAAGTVGNTKVHDQMTMLAKQNFGKLLVANRGQQRPINGPGATWGMGYEQPSPVATMQAQ